MYCFHTSPGFAINIRTEDATFTLFKGKLTVEGSFITEVHFVASTGRRPGELVHAAFWGSELKCEIPESLPGPQRCRPPSGSVFLMSHSEYNTGPNMITGLCGERTFFLGPGRSYSCGTLIVQTKYASATFTTSEWQSTVRGNHVYDRLSGPMHRLDVSLRANKRVAAGTTHGAAENLTRPPPPRSHLLAILMAASASPHPSPL